jgi:hypothetical protein
MNALATLFPAMRDKIFFWARRPISRALNALSLMTAKMIIIEQIEKNQSGVRIFENRLVINQSHVRA